MSTDVQEQEWHLANRSLQSLALSFISGANTCDFTDTRNCCWRQKYLGQGEHFEMVSRPSLIFLLYFPIMSFSKFYISTSCPSDTSSSHTPHQHKLKQSDDNKFLRMVELILKRPALVSLLHVIKNYLSPWPICRTSSVQQMIVLI